jgi:serine protease
MSENKNLRNAIMRNTRRKETQGPHSTSGQPHLSNTAGKQRSVATAVAAVLLSLALGACGGSSGGDSTKQTTPQSQESKTLEQTASLAAQNPTTPLALSLKMNTSNLGADASVDRFIIKYKDGTSENKSTSAVQSRLDRLSGAFPAKAHHSRRMGIGSDVVQTARKLNGAEARAFMRAVASDPDVEFIEPDREMSVMSVPNDPEYSRQWYLASNQNPGQKMAGIRAEGAWDVGTGAGSVIAVIDNGVANHSDLNANYLPGYDFWSRTSGGNGMNPGITGETSCKTTLWHGTHVAGIAAALTNNGIGIAGIAPAAKILSVRVMNACGRGVDSDIADGITWAAGGSVPGVPTNSNPANIINLSLGGVGDCGRTLQSAINFATSKGAVVVVAAGNNGIDATNWSPANCQSVITVGGSNGNGTKYVTSNFGPYVDVAAPGGTIWSTYNSGSVTPGVESYAYMDGTSMAAPQVAGVVALARSVAPKSLTTAEMRTLVQQNVQPFAPQQPDQPIGSGILDATATVNAAKSGKIPSAADFTCSQHSEMMQVTCTDLSTARGSATIVSWAWNFSAGSTDMVRTQSLNPYVNYEYAGVYPIRLTVTDSNGAKSTYTRPFLVKPPAIFSMDFGRSTTLFLEDGHMVYYELTVPTGTKSISVTLAPGQPSDTAWLYLKAGTPTVLNANCQSGMGGAKTASCTMDNPAAGVYYAIVSAHANLRSTLTTNLTK